MNHTPTPFRIAAIVNGRIAGDAGVKTDKYQLLGANCTVATIYRQSDAAFVQSACNAHDELVAALTDVTECLEAHRFDADEGESNWAVTEIAAARAALAKVNGGHS